MRFQSHRADKCSMRCGINKETNDTRHGEKRSKRNLKQGAHFILKRIFLFFLFLSDS